MWNPICPLEAENRVQDFFRNWKADKPFDNKAAARKIVDYLKTLPYHVEGTARSLVAGTLLRSGLDTRYGGYDRAWPSYATHFENLFNEVKRLMRERPYHVSYNEVIHGDESISSKMTVTLGGRKFKGHFTPRRVDFLTVPDNCRAYEFRAHYDGDIEAIEKRPGCHYFGGTFVTEEEIPAELWEYDEYITLEGGNSFEFVW